MDSNSSSKCFHGTPSQPASERTRMSESSHVCGAPEFGTSGLHTFTVSASHTLDTELYPITSTCTVRFLSRPFLLKLNFKWSLVESTMQRETACSGVRTCVAHHPYPPTPPPQKRAQANHKNIARMRASYVNDRRLGVIPKYGVSTYRVHFLSNRSSCKCILRKASPSKCRGGTPFLSASHSRAKEFAHILPRM